MSAKRQAIKDLELDTKAPTHANLNQLYTWVVWQFPRPAQAEEEGYYGAVHPPHNNHSWYPAVVNADKKSILIYAHLDAYFDSPEEAAAHFTEAHREK